MHPIPPEAASALVAAGSQQLSPAARQELQNRIGRYGVCEAAKNVGGVGCVIAHAHGIGERCLIWRGRPIEVFPDWASGAVRAVRLAHLATGSDARTRADGTSGFRTIAPDDDELPLSVSHTSGSEEEQRALFAALSQQQGDDDKARSLVAGWAAASPSQRAELRREAEAQELADGRPESALSGSSMLDALAGIDTAQDELAGKKKKKKKNKTVKKAAGDVAKIKAKIEAAKKKQAAANVAKEAAKKKQAAANVARQKPQEGELPPLPSLAEPVEPVEPSAEQLAPGAPQTIAPPPDGTVEALQEHIAALEQELAMTQAQITSDEISLSDLEATAGELEELAGPSAASEHTFQDLSAATEAVRQYAEKNPAAAKEIGWDRYYNDPTEGWKVFAEAWKAGNDKHPSCNGSCEDGINARLQDLARLKVGLKKIDPAWGDKLTVPAELTLEQRHPRATTVDTTIVAPLLRVVPGLDRLTNPTDGLLSGKAPTTHYVGAGAAVLALLAALGYGVSRAISPSRRRS